MKFKTIIAFLLVAFSLQAKVPGHIRVSDNHRFLQYTDGTPFFYLADTAWELFHRLNREEADRYLADRAAKGFTAIQAVALAELEGCDAPNAYGQLPFVDSDPLKPNEEYWKHVDYIVKKANELGLYIGMLPTWGRYWHEGKVIFNKDNAAEYGLYIGQRYKDAKIIWILGGDRVPDNEYQKDIIRAMARGLKNGDDGRHLISYHPGGWNGSANYFHNEDWLDFNMRQNGHEVEYKSYGMTRDDYNRQPVKPVIDGEAIYEDHPVAFRPDERGHSVAADCRRALYWDLFNGACGHTYGHHSIWQMYEPDKREPINRPLIPWYEAISQPGSSQMQYARKLLLSRPYFTREPASERVIIPDQIESSVPGCGQYTFVATGDTDHTYAMVYAPVGRRFTVRQDAVNAPKITAWWYNPRNGKATKIGTFNNDADRTFISPTPGEATDWILVIDDASKKYKAPGR